MRALIASATPAGVRASSVEDVDGDEDEDADGDGANFCAARRAAHLRGFASPIGGVVRLLCSGATGFDGSAEAPGHRRRRRDRCRTRGVFTVRFVLAGDAACVINQPRIRLGHRARPVDIGGGCSGRRRHAGGLQQIGAHVVVQTRGCGARARLADVDLLRLRRRRMLRGRRCRVRRIGRGCALARVDLCGGRLGGIHRCIHRSTRNDPRGRLRIVAACERRVGEAARRLGPGFRARAEHRREHVRHAARVRIGLHRLSRGHRARRSLRGLRGHHIRRCGVRCAHIGARSLRRDRREVAVGQCDDLDTAVVHGSIGQHDRVGAQCFAHETQCVATGGTDKFTNVQAGPPMR
ncbi:hypothetical protein ABIE53_000112 [Burkholderia sp. OAS925]